VDLLWNCCRGVGRALLIDGDDDDDDDDDDETLAQLPSHQSTFRTTGAAHKTHAGEAAAFKFQF